MFWWDFWMPWNSSCDHHSVCSTWSFVWSGAPVQSGRCLCMCSDPGQNPHWPRSAVGPGFPTGLLSVFCSLAVFAVAQWGWCHKTASFSHSAVPGFLPWMPCPCSVFGRWLIGHPSCLSACLNVSPAWSWGADAGLWVSLSASYSQFLYLMW